jgi:hypothetical protein
LFLLSRFAGITLWKSDVNSIQIIRVQSISLHS